MTAAPCATATQHLEHEARLASLSSALSTLGDKPEETAASTLRALWLLASGQAASVELAQGLALPELDGEGFARRAWAVIEAGARS